ncbi:LysR family transcriptional regulator [Actinomadura rupiterrae]|uniref:LysR family transcriptional regulator n=1 Tax=Actinomadura rupiterrae TaxID=559627 RepID=UPI0020A5E85B|nr:LysR substrate-binding domain-containing protein [Actinomadura rupiterrae]MCP2342431.1 DNA-binding transcriptional LysR family regulator [Actinomadura rupiterrae]
MEARHLRYALALAEHAHFGRAAAALGIAQPPLSRQIADLERELGTPLFRRTGHGVFPTAAGEALLARARAVVAELEAIGGDVGRAARGESGELRLAFVGSALADLLPTVLTRFGTERPRVRLRLQERSSAGCAVALADGAVDAIVTRGAPRGPGAERTRSVVVGHDRLVALVPRGHPLAGAGPLRRDRLRGQTLITAPPDEEPATADTMPAFKAGRIVHAHDVHTIAGLVACGVGLGLGPSCVRRVIRSDVLVRELDPPAELPPLVLSHRDDDPPSPVLEAFLSVLWQLRVPPR